jgi:hypothetical protein
MNPEESEFPIQEYRTSVAHGRWLEEMIERKFKTLSVVFIWLFVLIAYALHDDVQSGDIITAFWQSNARAKGSHSPTARNASPSSSAPIVSRTSSRC